MADERPPEPVFERGDEGKGSFKQYKYDLIPANGRGSAAAGRQQPLPG